MNDKLINFSFSIEEKETLLSDFENYLRNEGQRLNTVNGNVNSVKRFLRWLEEQKTPYLEVVYTDLLAYVNFCKDNSNATRTINANLVAIKHFYNYLQQVEQIQINQNPCEELRLKNTIKRQPHDLLSWEELQDLYEKYPNQNLTGKRNKIMVGMMIYQGVHSGELARVEVTGIKLEEGKIYIPSVGRSNSRILKLESFQILQLQKYITEIRPLILAMKGNDYQSDLLFISTGKGNQLNNSLFQLLKAAKRINKKAKTSKQIRASVITHWLKHHNIRQAQYMSGHRYISSTEHYRTDNLETLQEQINELHPLK